MGYLTYEDGNYIRTARTQYLSYTVYEAMGGTLDEPTFDEYEYEAETRVNWHTFNRLKKEDPENYPDELERCMYQLIKLLQNKANVLNTGAGANGEQANTSNIASQSNDGVSISYNVLSAKDILQVAQNEVDNCIRTYLQGVTNSLGQKLLYRGVYPNE